MTAPQATKPTTRLYHNYIDGAWTSSSDGSMYTIINPGDTKHVVGRFPLSTAEDVGAAIEAAHQAFLQWRYVPAPKRMEYILKFIEICQQRQHELAEAMTLEMGKPLREAYAEIKRGLDETQFAAGEALRFGGQTLPSARPNLTAYTLCEPLGVVAAITPWNFPVIAPLRKVIPALIYGCTVVLKPASQTPLSAVLLVEMLQQSGLPAGVVNLVLGRGQAIGDVLVSHPKVDGVTFTGSTEVGLDVAAKAAAHNAKLQLEMGGKNACVVAGYADIPGAAAQIVAAAYQTSGQRCTSISRVIVLEEQRGALEAALVAEVERLQVGYGLDEGTTMGPLVSRSQLERAMSYVEQAQQEGASVLTGGSRLTGAQYDRGYYFEPTILTDVKPGTAAARDEIFGPVLVVIPVQTFNQALAVANEVKYGLTASIFTDNMNQAHLFISHVQSGMVHVNHGTISEAHLPFGGIKQSGMGAYSIGATNKDFFTNLKVVYHQFPA